MTDTVTLVVYNHRVPSWSMCRCVLRTDVMSSIVMEGDPSNPYTWSPPSA
ncbi:hypothetical protein ACWGIV_25920 [Streptomyces sp. NPDC054844]